MKLGYFWAAKTPKQVLTLFLNEKKKKTPLKTDSEEFNEANLTLKLIFSDMAALVPTSSSMNAVFRSYSVLYD